MDDNESTNVNFLDLDLNQEQVDPPLHRVTRNGSFLNELETAHETIEERIRQLQAVHARTIQRQRWRQGTNSIETSEDARGVVSEYNNTIVVVERGKGYKRDSSRLVARALKRNSMDGGSFYDCNICLDIAREPILTSCGHLFCWPCFYQVPYIDATTKECPVCDGAVSDSAVIPIFGNGGGDPVFETESGLIIPPRPKARRIEGVKQQCRATRVPVVEVVRRIRNRIGAMEGQTQQLESSSRSEGVGGHLIRIRVVSRMLTETSASLSSLSSALINAETLVEDLDTVINNQVVQNDAAGALPLISNNNQPPDAAVDSSTQSTSRVLQLRSLVSTISSVDSQDSHAAPPSSSSSSRWTSLMSIISNLR